MEEEATEDLDELEDFEDVMAELFDDAIGVIELEDEDEDVTMDEALEDATGCCASHATFSIGSA